jgi:cytochrome P450
MFQPKYTMNGLEVDDRMSGNGNIHSRALQVELRSHLGVLQYPLSERIAAIFAEEMTSGTPLPGEWRLLQSFPVAKRLITAVNSLAFFGDEVSHDPAFLKAALDYPEDLMVTAEALRFIPTCLASFAAPRLMGRYEASRILVNRLTPLVEQRLRCAYLAETDTDSSSKPLDCIQFFVDASMRKRSKESWSAQKIVQALLGVWFASVHQPSMSLVYALDDLCFHPEYIDLLRDEISTGICEGRDLDSLPLLDSFLKESARLNPSDSISVRRKVLQPFTFGDGTRLMQNDVACIPLQPILRDPNTYQNPLEFDAFRFLRDTTVTGSKSTSRFTDSNAQFPLWGLGKRTW